MKTQRKRKLISLGMFPVLVVALVVAFAFSNVGTQSASAIFHADNPSGKTTSAGTPLYSKSLDAKSGRRAAPKISKNTPKAECPSTIKCVVVPAAYQQNGDDPGNYGNYDKANRPNDMEINSIVLHDTEGDLQSVLNAFQDPTFYASAHYVIDKDGTVYQMVRDKDIAWHAGSWWYNMHSIGIEHVGFSHSGSSDYTPAMYKASTELVKWLSRKYAIPYDHQHILGHDNVPASRSDLVAGMHTDPGPYWNWSKYSQFGGLRLAAPQGIADSKKQEFAHAASVKIAPLWPYDKQPVTGCSTGAMCVPTTPQPTNFAYLRTEPRPDAPFITDAVVGTGSTDISNNAARVFYGQSFVVANAKMEQGGIWYEIWVNGGTGWLYSPWGAPVAFPSVGGAYVTPKAGRDTVPVYGRAVPKAEDYPSDFTPPAGAIPSPSALPYVLKAGQRYRLVSCHVPNDHYYAWTIDSSLPYDHTVFKGKDTYCLIQFGNRLAFVRADDVKVQR
jgi:N-acetyl-anhydromuramyl-L-alanine amidase AmpD